MTKEIYFLFAVLGLVFGSFATVLTSRIFTGEGLWGRSICPKCKKKIFWFDNLPLLSFLLLGGKCRSCKKKISLRYPLIELTSLVFFLLIPISLNYCPPSGGAISCIFLKELGYFYYPLMIFLFLILLSTLVTDLERGVIPDIFVFLGVLVFILFYLGFDKVKIYDQLFAGFFSASFLMFLNLLTKGGGLGLGDVKLAILTGLILGFWQSVFWLMLSFILGAVAGLIIIISGKGNMKSKVPFGPFMIVSFLAVFLFNFNLISLVLR